MKGLDFRKDESRPGGGIFVADKNVPHNLPNHSVVVRGEEDEKDGGGVSTIKNEEVNGTAPPAVRSTTDGVPLLFPSASLHHPGAAITSNGHIGPYGPSQGLRDNHQQVYQTGDPRHHLAGSAPGMVTLTPLSGGGLNVNPEMHTAPAAPNVQVMNVLDYVSQYPGGVDQRVLASLATEETAMLEGIPGSMFDWGKEISDLSSFRVQVF